MQKDARLTAGFTRELTSRTSRRMAKFSVIAI